MFNSFSLRGIEKNFGSVVAANNVSLEIHNGQVLALLGENGAGKSTLMKLLYGFYQPDSGEILVDDRVLENHSPERALHVGIGMLFQQFNLIPALSVIENLLLALPDTPWWLWRNKKLHERVLESLHSIAPELDPQKKIRDLSVGEQQIVELAKIMALDANLVILDEPTAVLTPQEVTRLYAFVNQCRNAGKAVVLITHKMADVRACADRIVVMRKGTLVGDWLSDEVNDTQLVQAMVGEEAELFAHRSSPPQNSVTKLWVKDLSVASAAGNIHNIEFELYPGEVLGVAGVMGNGQQVLAAALAGILVPHQGEIILDGVQISANSEDKLKVPSTVAYIPESPIQNAVAGQLNLATNLQLRELKKLPFLLRGTPAIEEAKNSLLHNDVRPADPMLEAQALSGGNLQKLVIARELSRAVEMVVASYPSMGLDLIAARNVYERLFAQAESGACIVWFCEDLDDLFRYAHRILVLYDGRVQSIAPTSSFDRQHIGRLMTGQSE